MVDNANLCKLKKRQINGNGIGFLEIKRRGEDCLKFSSGHSFYYKGRKDKSLAAVGFIMKRRLSEKEIEYTALTESIALIIMDINQTTFPRIIDVYSPTFSHIHIDYWRKHRSRKK